jgi:shikimate kinase
VCGGAEGGVPCGAENGTAAVAAKPSSGTPKPSSGAARVSSLALVGFMGAGKSAVGMGVAHRRSLPFIDSDAVIEEQMGPIAEIFAAHGEARFRAVEGEVCTALLERACVVPLVVSLGGGAVLSGDVRAALRGVAHVAWLTAPADVLWERVAAGGEAAVRPLARDRAAFAALLAEREPLYREVATAIVDNGAGHAVDEVVDELVRLTEPAPDAHVEES